jgi:hypothetical protein
MIMWVTARFIHVIIGRILEHRARRPIVHSLMRPSIAKGLNRGSTSDIRSGTGGR